MNFSLVIVANGMTLFYADDSKIAKLVTKLDDCEELQHDHYVNF